MNDVRLLLAATVLFLTACEPASLPSLVVDGLTCTGGSLPANFTGLTVGVPLDHAFRVTDEAGDVVALEAAFGEGSDPSMRLLRAPFAADGAVVVPFRVQPTGPGRVEGTLALTPADEGVEPCLVAVTAAAG